MTSYVDVFTGSIVDPQEVSYRPITLIADIALVWPSLSETDPEVAARIMDVDAALGPFSISMPPANQVGRGVDALFNNIGANAFTVLDADGNTLGSIAPGETKYLYLTDNTTVSGSWRIFTFGTGTSGADASALAGPGLKAEANLLELNLLVTDISTSPRPITSADRGQILQCTGGTTVSDLPAVASVGDGFIFAARNNGTGIWFLQATGADTVNNPLITIMVLNPGDSCFFIGDGGTRWVTVANAQAATFAYSVLSLNVGGTGTTTLTSDQAENTIINLVGTLTGARLVRVPAIPRVYFISNLTTGAFPLTVSTTTGTTAVLPITQGLTETIVCDSTTVRKSPALPTTQFFAFGTAAAPSISFIADPDSGLFHPVGDNQVAVTVGGAEVARFSVNQMRLGVGLASINSFLTPLQLAVGLSSSSGPSPVGSLYLGGSTLNVAIARAFMTDVFPLAGTATEVRIYSSEPQSPTGALTDLHQFHAEDPVAGGPVLTNNVGYYADTLTRGTNNFGFYGDVANAAGRWNCYMAGTAPNFFAGEVRIGANADLGVYPLQVTGDSVIASVATNLQATTAQIVTSGAAIVGSVASVTLTNLIPAGVLVLGVTTRVTTAITGATSFQVGDGTDTDKWGATVNIALNTTSDGADFTALTPTFYPATTSVVLTANGGNFTAGNIRVAVHYIDLIPPSS